MPPRAAPNRIPRSLKNRGRAQEPSGWKQALRSPARHQGGFHVSRGTNIAPPDATPISPIGEPVTGRTVAGTGRRTVRYRRLAELPVPRMRGR